MTRHWRIGLTLIGLCFAGIAGGLLVLAYLREPSPTRSGAQLASGPLHRRLAGTVSQAADLSAPWVYRPWALFVYDAAVDLAPDEPEPLVRRGFYKLQDKRLDEAMVDFDAAIDLRPSDPEAYYDRAQVWEGKSNFDRAVNDFSTVIKLAPGSNETYYARARIKQKMGRFDETLQDLDAAIAIAALPQYLSLKGDILQENYQDFDDADVYYASAINRASSYSRAYMGRGVISMTRHDYPEAVRFYDDAIESSKASEDFNAQSVGWYYQNRATALYLQHEMDRALADARLAVTLKGDSNATANYDLVLAQALMDKADLSGARVRIDEAIRLFPMWGLAYKMRGDMESRSNDIDAAIADYGKAIAYDSDDIAAFTSGDGAYANRARAWLKKNDRDQARSDFFAAYQTDIPVRDFQQAALDKLDEIQGVMADAAEFYKLRGDLNVSLSRVDEAIANYGKALELDPKDLESFKSKTGGAYSNRASALLRKGDRAAAQSDFEAAARLATTLNASEREAAFDNLKYALEMWPDNAELYIARGDLEAAAGRIDDAIASYGEALADLRMPGTDADLPRTGAAEIQSQAFAGRAAAWLKKGELAKAHDDFDHALAALAGKSPINVNVGRFRFQREAAQARLSIALSEAPQSAETYTLRGDAQRQFGDLDGAIANFTKALELDVKYVDAKIKRGRAWMYGKNDRAKAGADFDAALADDPENSHAQACAREVREPPPPDFGLTGFEDPLPRTEC